MGIVLEQLPDGTYDIKHDANGKMQRGDTYLQEVGLLLEMNQGELKSDPLLGCNLVRLTNGAISEKEFQNIVRLQLARDGKSYEQVKDLLTLKRKVN